MANQGSRMRTISSRRNIIAVAIAIGLCALTSRSSAQLPVRLPALEVAAPRQEHKNGPAEQIAASASLDAKLRERGDLVLSDTTLRQALFTISEAWQLNLVVGEDVSGQVNGTFKNAPLHEILNSILYANGYSYRVVGQGLVVMKLDQLGDANPLFETAAIPVRTIDPKDVLEGVNLLRSPQGKVTVIASARTLMVVDMPERIAVIRDFVRQVDDAAAGKSGVNPAILERRVAQYVPQYVKVLTLKESLDAVLSKDGKVVAIENENRLVIVDYPPNLDLAMRMLKEMDVARPQVRITALIYDVSLDDLERLGINWNHAAKGNSVTSTGVPEAMWAVDSLTAVPVAAGTPAASMTFMNLSRNFDIRATIEALCQSKDAQLLADPSVTVVDREPAQIQIITEIPYQQLTQTQQGGNIGTTAFREAGVTLRVIPHIADDHTVQMEVTPTFSRLTGFTNGQSPQPIIDKREAKTTVRVIDQQWLVIGGLRQRTAVKDDRAVPGLGSMKHLGKLFQAFDYSFRESELIVFIRPEVVAPTYIGRERELESLRQGALLLDETPIAPHVLGQGEVGCPTCGKHNCQGCGNRWRKPWNNNRNDVPMCEEAPQRYEPLPAPQATPLQASSQAAIRRLPRVEPSTSVAPPPPLRTPAQSTSGPALAPPKTAKKSMLFGQPPLAPATSLAAGSSSAQKSSTTESSRRTAKNGGKALGSSGSGSTAKSNERKKPEGLRTATSKDATSTSWMPSWWR